MGLDVIIKPIKVKSPVIKIIRPVVVSFSCHQFQSQWLTLYGRINTTVVAGALIFTDRTICLFLIMKTSVLPSSSKQKSLRYFFYFFFQSLVFLFPPQPFGFYVESEIRSIYIFLFPSKKFHFL